MAVAGAAAAPAPAMSHIGASSVEPPHLMGWSSLRRKWKLLFSLSEEENTICISNKFLYIPHDGGAHHIVTPTYMTTKFA